MPQPIKMIMVKVAPLADTALAGMAKVVKEGTVRRFHRETDGAFEVPLTSHYIRRLARGELVRVDPVAEKDTDPAGKLSVEVPAFDETDLVTTASEDQDNGD